jgi:hypothetical protein
MKDQWDYDNKNIINIKQRLQYRRQFLLAEASIMGLSDWQCLQIGKYYLYAHPDLEVNQAADSQKNIVIIGDIYDPAEPHKENADILKDIMANAASLDGLISWIKRYAGRYALLYICSKNEIILHDARALREIYYCTKNNQIVCGSQPNLLAKFSNPQIETTSDADIIDFYRNHFKSSQWIGDDTYYSGIKHLLPNRYLDISRRQIHRYWPNRRIKQLELEEAVTKSCSFLQGMLKAIVHRHSAMMAVTAGMDSRPLLAATKGIHDKIYYFINNEGLGHHHPDILVPEKIFESLGIPFHVHDIPKNVDDEFRQIFIDNTFHATERILPTIYNVYFKSHGQKVNILGLGEIGRNFYGNEPINWDSYRMAYKLGYKKSNYVIKQCKQILAEMSLLTRKFSINVATLLYWEQRAGNWGAVGNSESDIAIEEIDPYDSHLLYEIFLGVDKKYTRKKDTIFFREMIRSMWPELLEFPINPPYTMREKCVGLLRQAGIFEPMKELKYQANYFMYLLRTRL